MSGTRSLDRIYREKTDGVDAGLLELSRTPPTILIFAHVTPIVALCSRSWSLAAAAAVYPIRTGPLAREILDRLSFREQPNLVAVTAA